MKSYDQRIESIFRKYDERLTESKRRHTIIKRSVVSSAVCAAAIAGVWLMSADSLRNAAKPPHTDLMIVETTVPTGTAPEKESTQTTAVPSPTATAQAVRSTALVNTAQAVTGTVPSTERQAPAKTESAPSAPSAPAYAPATTAAPVIQASVTAPVTAAVTQMQTAATPATTESPAVTTTPQTENLYDPRKTYTFELDGITYEVSGEAADLEFFQSIDFVEYTEMLTKDDSGNVTSVKGCIANAQPLSEMVFFQILCVVETENGQEYFIAHPIN